MNGAQGECVDGSVRQAASEVQLGRLRAALRSCVRLRAARGAGATPARMAWLVSRAWGEAGCPYRAGSRSKEGRTAPIVHVVVRRAWPGRRSRRMGLGGRFERESPRGRGRSRPEPGHLGLRLGLTLYSWRGPPVRARMDGRVPGGSCAEVKRSRGATASLLGSPWLVLVVTVTCATTG